MCEHQAKVIESHKCVQWILDFEPLLQEYDKYAHASNNDNDNDDNIKPVHFKRIRNALKILKHVPCKIQGTPFVIQKKWIGRGSHSMVLSCALQTKQLEQKFVCKIGLEPLDDSILMEHQLVTSLHHKYHKDVLSIPKSHWCGTLVFEQTSFMGMIYDRVGPTLSQLLQKQGTIPLEYVLSWGRQLVLTLKFLHQSGYAHASIKPDNICMEHVWKTLTGKSKRWNKQHRKKKPSPWTKQVFLIDFGGCTRLLPYSFHEWNASSPTFLYLSLHAHTNGTFQAQDDLIALAYVLLHLIRGNLPWSSTDAVVCKSKPAEEVFVDMNNVVISSLVRYMNTLEKCVENTHCKYVSPNSELYDQLIRNLCI